VKIAFWSNANEKSGVTANLAAISVASVIRFPYNILAFENHLCNNNLGCAYLGTSKVEMLREVGTNYYEGGGIEGLLRGVYRGEYNFDRMRLYMKEIINKHLYYIPQSKVIPRELFDYEFNNSIQPLLSFLEEYTDISFIDTASRYNLSSKTILEEADLIVVNLSQSPVIIEDFLLNYSSLIPKAVFLIGKYNNHSIFNSKKLSQIYEIPIERITAIPYNEMFCNAFLNGSIVEFIYSNYTSERNNPNYSYIQALKKATYMIIKHAELLGGLKRRELYPCIQCHS